MLKNYGLKVGDEFRMRTTPYYGCGKIKEILPKGAHGKTYRLARVLWRTDWDFDCGMSFVKTFALRDMIKREAAL